MAEDIKGQPCLQKRVIRRKKQTAEAEAEEAVNGCSQCRCKVGIRNTGSSEKCGGGSGSGGLEELCCLWDRRAGKEHQLSRITLINEAREQNTVQQHLYWIWNSLLFQKRSSVLDMRVWPVECDKCGFIEAKSAGQVCELLCWRLLWRHVLICGVDVHEQWENKALGLRLLSEFVLRTIIKLIIWICQPLGHLFSSEQCSPGAVSLSPCSSSHHSEGIAASKGVNVF